MVIDKSFLESYQRRFRELYDELPKQIIHRDPNPSNIITNDDKWGFIDFDLSECSVRIYDPCYAASAILSESFELDNPDKLKKWIEIFREIMYTMRLQNLLNLRKKQFHMFYLQISS